MRMGEIDFHINITNLTEYSKQFKSVLDVDVLREQAHASNISICHCPHHIHIL